MISFCTECGRARGTGPADDRWWVFMPIANGLDVAPWHPDLAHYSDRQACGDAHASLMFARWLATGRLDKPIADLPPFRGSYTLSCMTPGCDFKLTQLPWASAGNACPKCGGTTFSNYKDGGLLAPRGSL